MRTMLRSKVTLLFVTLGLLLSMAGVAYASDVNVAVVDVDVAPANSADLKPGGTSNLNYTMTVTGPNAGYSHLRDQQGLDAQERHFTGSNPQEFTVPVRTNSSPAATFTTTGTLTVDSTQADVLGKQLVVPVFDITNTNTTGAKLGAGTSGTYTVNVDGTKPTITLTSPEDGKTYAVGSSLTASYTCQDNTGGTGIATTGGCVGTQSNGATISTSTAGPRTFTVTATDKAGNTETVTHNYSVANPNTKPTLTVPSNITEEATSSSGAAVTYTATASDTEDGNLTSSVQCTPASGSTFALGTTTVDCTVTDSGGLSDSKSFSVTVQDTTKPDLTLPANITEEATGANGAEVTFNATATDKVDGNVAVTCVPASGSTFAITTTTVNCSATDAANNTAEGSFTVTVEDTTAPVIAAHTDVNATATSANGAVVTYTAPGTTDAVDGPRNRNLLASFWHHVRGGPDHGHLQRHR